jgi:hypothetical protein
MMNKIYKYTLFTRPDHELSVSIDIPDNAKILSCQFQHGTVSIWALIDENEPTVTRVFTCYGTGFELPDRNVRKHIATLQEVFGVGLGYVWHIFEEE